MLERGHAEEHIPLIVVGLTNQKPFSWLKNLTVPVATTGFLWIGEIGSTNVQSAVGYCMKLAVMNVEVMPESRWTLRPEKTNDPVPAM